jgi:Ca2+-binding EF-hand superfamily protein
VLRLVILMILMPGLALAEATLPEPLVKKVQKNPEAFVDMASGLVAGFGGPGGLGADGIETYIAIERAKARASALRRMLAMDLDDDGAVSATELEVVIKAAGAMQRGRILRSHAAADLDGDGQVEAEEVKADAEAAALRSLTVAEADLARGLLLFDRDGDGRASLAEITAGVAALDEGT